MQVRWLWACVLLCGCGPIAYVNQVTRGAASAVERAEAVEAETRSPYHFTRAKLFLRKAREEVAHAEFQAAIRYGKLSQKAAEAAVEQAKNNPWQKPVRKPTPPAVQKGPSLGDENREDQAEPADPASPVRGTGTLDDDAATPDLNKNEENSPQ